MRLLMLIISTCYVFDKPKQIVQIVKFRATTIESTTLNRFNLNKKEISSRFMIQRIEMVKCRPTSDSLNQTTKIKMNRP